MCIYEADGEAICSQTDILWQHDISKQFNDYMRVSVLVMSHVLLNIFNI